jgi:NNP family nitrate/nitrite transporter-like MFS transporter
MLGEGALVCVFSTAQSLAGAIVVMALFSIFAQAAEGAAFSIVPYIDLTVTGSISGIVGAAGNFGAVGFSLIFREYNNRMAFFFMGCMMVLASSVLSAFIYIPGHI